MRILIAEDDPSSRLLLKTTLEKWQYEVIPAQDGDEAWSQLQGPDIPSIAILDWMMPGTDGAELCQKIRNDSKLKSMYLILLTAKASNDDIVEGLQAGADDYIVKPFNREELRARVTVGVRIVALQQDLANQIAELEDAISRVKVLQGLLPICSYCKKIRDDKNYWQQVESYFGRHSEARFSHSVCPDCYDEHIEPQLKKLKQEMGKS